MIKAVLSPVNHSPQRVGILHGGGSDPGRGGACPRAVTVTLPLWDGTRLVTLPDLVRQLRRAAWDNAMARNNGNLTNSCRDLDVGRASVYRWFGGGR